MSSNASLFGNILVAMVTPMTPDGSVSEPDAKRLADHLIDLGCDGIVVNGTTGESATLSAQESMDLIRLVAQHVGDRAKIVAGVGSNDTAHCVQMTRQATQAGADGLLLVSPYYNKPTQKGLIAHCQAVCEATDLPIMLYDIPGRTGVAFQYPTMLELAKLANVKAIKDAKGDQWEASKIMANTDLAIYSGSDEANLSLMSLGGSGIVSVVGHVAANYYRAMRECLERGDLGTAQRIHRALIPLTEAIMHTSQGAIMAKAAMVKLGVIEHARVRLPYVESDAADLAKLDAAFEATPTLESLLG